MEIIAYRMEEGERRWEEARRETGRGEEDENAKYQCVTDDKTRNKRRVASSVHACTF